MSLDRYLDKDKLFYEHLERVRACNDCALPKLGQHKCCGLGNLNAKTMFVGEAPGEVANPDLRGLPFVGNRSSDLLLEMLYEYWPNGYDDVYITNIVKCNPPMNRQPKQDEIQSCSKWLFEEMMLVKPKIIVPLGRTATNWFDIKDSLSYARLKKYDYHSSWGYGRVCPVWHPAYVLRCGDRMLEAYKGFFRTIRGLEQRLELTRKSCKCGKH